MGRTASWRESEALNRREFWENVRRGGIKAANSYCKFSLPVSRRPQREVIVAAAAAAPFCNRCPSIVRSSSLQLVLAATMVSISLSLPFSEALSNSYNLALLVCLLILYLVQTTNRSFFFCIMGITVFPCSFRLLWFLFFLVVGITSSWVVSNTPFFLVPVEPATLWSS